MKFALTKQLLDEVRQYNLKSACGDCFFQKRDGSCAHEWPNADQRRWPPDAPNDDGSAPTDMHICKEFELR